MSAPGENLRIDPARLWDSLMEMAKIGPGVGGGNNRQTLTDADAEGRALFQRWCEAAGMSMGVDQMGTMFATRPGTDPQALALPLSYLHYHHPMPETFKVTARPELYVPMNRLPSQAVDAREGIRALPPILKGYVRAGCCIGDGAVIDRQFDTIDVFIFFPLSGIDARYKSRFGLVK